MDKNGFGILNVVLLLLCFRFLGILNVMLLLLCFRFLSERSINKNAIKSFRFQVCISVTCLSLYESTVQLGVSSCVTIRSLIRMQLGVNKNAVRS